MPREVKVEIRKVITETKNSMIPELKEIEKKCDVRNVDIMKTVGDLHAMFNILNSVKKRRDQLHERLEELERKNEDKPSIESASLSRMSSIFAPHKIPTIFPQRTLLDSNLYIFTKENWTLRRQIETEKSKNFEFEKNCRVQVSTGNVRKMENKLLNVQNEIADMMDNPDSISQDIHDSILRLENEKICLYKENLKLKKCILYVENNTESEYDSFMSQYALKRQASKIKKEQQRDGQAMEYENKSLQEGIIKTKDEIKAQLEVNNKISENLDKCYLLLQTTSDRMEKVNQIDQMKKKNVEDSAEVRREIERHAVIIKRFEGDNHSLEERIEKEKYQNKHTKKVTKRNELQSKNVYYKKTLTDVVGKTDCQIQGILQRMNELQEEYSAHKSELNQMRLSRKEALKKVERLLKCQNKFQVSISSSGSSDTSFTSGSSYNSYSGKFEIV